MTIVNDAVLTLLERLSQQLAPTPADIAAALDANRDELKAAIKEMKSMEEDTTMMTQEQQEEQRFLQQLLSRFRDAEQRVHRKRKLRPSEKAMMLAEYRRDIDSIKRILKHYA